MNNSGQLLSETREEPKLIDSYDPGAARKRFNIIGFGFAIFTVITFVVCQMLSLVAIAAENISGVPVTSSTLFLNAVTPISIYLFALPLLLVFLGVFRIGGTAPQKKRMRFGTILVLFVVGFGLMYIGSYMGQFTMWGLSEIVGYNYSNMLNDMIDYDGMWITVLFLCVVAPIGEEFVFRKLIIDRTHKYGGAVSIFLSALMFGLMHANFYQFFYAFLLGLLLGYVYYSTGKVWYTVALHAAMNFVGSILTAYLQLGLDNFEKAIENLDFEDLAAVGRVYLQHGWAIIAGNAFTVFIMVAMLCAIIIPIIFRRRIILERGESPVPCKRSFAAAFGNVGVVVMLIVYGIQLAQNIILPPLAEYLAAMVQK